jgi:large subunit ribosomal protein L21e
MVKRSKGLRSKSRHILRRKPRERGKTPVTHTLADFAEGSKVAIKINPSVHGGMPHVRFQGMTGTVAGRQGEAYRLALNVGGKSKQLVVRPEHLKQVA